MNEGWILLVGVILGWGLDQAGRWIHGERERKERRMSVYQQLIAQLGQLQDTLYATVSYEQVANPLNSFKQWWYQNSLSLDEHTNDATTNVLNTVINRVIPKTLEETIEAGGNMLLDQNVSEAFEKAYNAIRDATSHRRIPH